MSLNAGILTTLCHQFGCQHVVPLDVIIYQNQNQKYLFGHIPDPGELC